MGTHPIFESDFDCLTECRKLKHQKKPQNVPEKKLEVNAEQFRQQISNQFQNLAVQQRRIQQVLAELNQERHEVTLIQENLKKTNLDRKCWRMVGGVLAEKTVAAVLIDLGTQLAEIDEVTGQVKEQLGGKTKEMTDFREKYQ